MNDDVNLLHSTTDQRSMHLKGVRLSITDNNTAETKCGDTNVPAKLLQKRMKEMMDALLHYYSRTIMFNLGSMGMGDRVR